VSAHLTGERFGIGSAEIMMFLAGRPTVVQQWRSESGWTGSATVRLPAPPSPGEWSARASAYGEVPFCMDGHIGWTYGGMTSNTVGLTVSGATLFLPGGIRGAGPTSTATPTTPPASPTASKTPTATATPMPLALSLDGYVLEGSGNGVAGVEVTLSIDGASAAAATTDADGFYATDSVVIYRGQTWTATPSKDGYRFEPPSASSGALWGGAMRVDFVAHRQAAGSASR
jgi:hypothetical protein